MNEEKCRKILTDCHEYFVWAIDEKDTTLDGVFTADQLEAIAWWMRNKPNEEMP